MGNVADSEIRLSLDYPDSDPEETFDREEPDYDEVRSEPEEADDYQVPNNLVRDHHLANMLRAGMRLGQGTEEEEEEEEENEEEINRWDHAATSRDRPFCLFLSFPFPAFLSF